MCRLVPVGVQRVTGISGQAVMPRAESGPLREQQYGSGHAVH